MLLAVFSLVLPWGGPSAARAAPGDAPADGETPLPIEAEAGAEPPVTSSPEGGSEGAPPPSAEPSAEPPDDDGDPPSYDSAEPSEDDGPALPEGLAELDSAEPGEDDGPALPEGLAELDSAEPGEDDGPALPEGLGGLDDTDTDASGADDTAGEQRGILDILQIGLESSFFATVQEGVRIMDDPNERVASLGEARVQLAFDLYIRDRFLVSTAADLVYDRVLTGHQIDLERGRGFVDLREANLQVTLSTDVRLSLGRQILTWGTGDLLFINDLFPKDWKSFLIGRENAYLKAPSDAATLRLYSGLANLDLVFVPRFEPDRFISGERISYYNPFLMARAGRNAILDPILPEEWLDDREWHLRITKNVRGMELAAYGFYGYWKSPAGVDVSSMAPTFPELSVYGASVRDQLWGGIANAELGYYDSREDRDGDLATIDNSEARALVGYERQVPEIAHDLTVSAQYYLEWMMHYDAYLASLPPGMPARDELRHGVTVRLSKLLLRQNLRATLFAFVSPSDLDAYLRASVQYKLNDHLNIRLGGNFFAGADEYTFFGQLEKNSNVYTGLEYGF